MKLIPRLAAASSIALVVSSMPAQARLVVLTKNVNAVVVPPTPDPTANRIFNSTQGKTVQNSIGEVQSGDTVQLDCGDHGSAMVENKGWTATTTFLGARDAQGNRCSKIGQFYAWGTSNIRFKGVKFQGKPEDQGLPRNLFGPERNLANGSVPELYSNGDGGGFVVSVVNLRSIPVQGVTTPWGMKFGTMTASTGETVIYTDGAAVTNAAKVTNITFDDCELSSADDASAWTYGTGSWVLNAAKTAYVYQQNRGEGTWSSKPWLGLLQIVGDGVTVKNSEFRNGRKAIAAAYSHNLTVDGNLIEDITVDGVEFGGNNIAITNNVMRNSRNNAGEHLHADCIQGYGAGANGASVTSYSGVVIQGNLCIDGPYAQAVEFVDDRNEQALDGAPAPIGTSTDPNAVRTYGQYHGFQGFSTFDGRWDRVTIDGNVVETSQYHGIGWFNGQNVTVTNNVVRLSPYATDFRKTGLGMPWIEVASSKATEGFQLPGPNIIVANNTVPDKNSLRMTAPGPYVASVGTTTGFTYSQGTGFVAGQSTITFDAPGDGFAAMTGTLNIGNGAPTSVTWDTTYNKAGAKFGHYTAAPGFTLGGPGTGANIVVRWLPDSYYAGWDNFAAQGNKTAAGAPITAPGFIIFP